MLPNKTKRIVKIQTNLEERINNLFIQKKEKELELRIINEQIKVLEETKEDIKQIKGNYNYIDA